MSPMNFKERALLLYPGVRAGSIPERIWTNLYVRGLSPTEAARAADVHAWNKLTPFERLLSQGSLASLALPDNASGFAANARGSRLHPPATRRHRLPRGQGARRLARPERGPSCPFDLCRCFWRLRHVLLEPSHGRVAGRAARAARVVPAISIERHRSANPSGMRGSTLRYTPISAVPWRDATSSWTVEQSFLRPLMPHCRLACASLP
jgi:hypothetical protein